MYALIDSQGKVSGNDSYGKATYQIGTQPIMAYAGLYKHDASDLSLATYRAYKPATARWIDRDPTKEAGGLNVYAYVGGDPILQVDPLGLQGLIPISIPAININPIGHGVKLHSSLSDFISLGRGSLFDGLSKQDNRCSVPLVGSILDKNECILERCKKHDDCYSEIECNYSSWGSSLLNGNKAYNQCNTGFFK